MSTCLIDADILQLAYECSACGQYTDDETNELIIREFDFVAELLDQRIQEIEAECWADKPSVLFLTGDERLNHLVNKRNRFLQESEVLYIRNFRHDVAVTKAYKGQRHQDKPLHFNNIRAYMLNKYNCIVTNGIEADDLICVTLRTNPEEYIACSRDKDLRQVEGTHFSWVCGSQPQWGPSEVTELGYIELTANRKKIKGTGLKFFYSQLITGDAVDNIPGLPKGGPVLAYESIHDCESEAELFERVSALYQQRFGDDWRVHFQEQADLLWMARELNPDGSIVKYVQYDRRGN